MQTAVDIKQLIKLQIPGEVTKPDGQSGMPGALEKFLSRKVSDRDRAEFCTQLAVMLQARISLHRALQVLARQTKHQRMKQVIEILEKEIQKGNSFDKAMANLSHQNHPDVFDNLFIVTAEVGQESGRLPEVLSHLAQHLEKMSALNRKFMQAMTYPALVVSVACFAVAFLLIFIVPAFAEMFKTFQVELPASTRMILILSHVVVDYGKYVVPIVIVVLFALRKLPKRPAVRRKLESFAFKVPLLGDILLKTHVSRFCRTLGTMLKAQVSLVDALGVALRIASNADVREEIGSILKHVRQGRAIADPLVGSKLFPPMVVQMIAVGEETSELDTMLLKVADYYEKELDAKVETLSSVIEPVIVLFLGLVVGGILVSMYMPMFELVNLVGGG